jgi:phage terminase large subunit-like protein
MSGAGSGKADDAVRFFERRLTHTKGEFAKKPFVLEPWQERIVRDLYGTVDASGNRVYNTAYIEIPKKNGKSELGAGVALAGLLLDEEPGAEVYSAAATRDQASIVFRVAAQMVRNDPVLNSLCRIIDSSKTIYVKDDPSSFYRAISADAGVQDGINPHIVVFDELHRQKRRDLWDIFRYGSPTRRQPLLFSITTAGVTGESPVCEEQHDYARRLIDGTFKDPSYYACIYGLGMDEDWTFEGAPAFPGSPATGWYKANPALGSFLPVERIRQECQAALEMPTQQNSFRRFRLNQWVGQETRFLPMEAWRNCGVATAPEELEELAGCECYGGLDLSTTRDLTAFVLMIPKDDLVYLIPHIFLPEEGLHERARKDNVPYDLWASQGFVHLTPGNQVDYGFVRKTIVEQAGVYRIREIGFDRWNAAQIVQQLMDDGLTMVPIGQGFQTMNAPTAELLALVRDGRLRHGGNPVLTWMADCMTVKQDPAGNIKPVKPDRMKNSKRIDGLVAAINALSRLIVQPTVKSVYETEGISFF